MDRRNFIKIVGFGALTAYLTGCGISAVNDNEEGVAAHDSVSGGRSLNIVLINGSPHDEKQSTSRYLAQRFAEGAEKSGHKVFMFDAANSTVNPCRGCDQCGMDGACIFEDDIEKFLMPKMLKSDLIILVTPLYYFGMSAQLKIVVDRFYSRSTKLGGKKTMLMATAWNSSPWTMDALKLHYETIARYMNWKDVGQVLAIGCGSRKVPELIKFGDMAHQIGLSL
ncbi:MAG: flavodoxin family protein [Selenomonadaceae bacterium]|nr:flavodoxin family protein [Selenomonadaceae bacterium]